MSTNRTGTIRGTLAATVRHHPDADVSGLRAELATERIAAYISRVVDASPPLSEDQRSRIAALVLRGSSA